MEECWRQTKSIAEAALVQNPSSIDGLILSSISKYGLNDLLSEWLLQYIQEKHIAIAASEFHSANKQSLRGFQMAMIRGYQKFSTIQNVCLKVDEVCKTQCEPRFRLLFDTAFIVGSNDTLQEFRSIVWDYLSKKLRLFCKDEELDDEELDGADDLNDEYPVAEFAVHIDAMGWTRLIEEPLSGLLCQEIEKRIENVCKGHYDESLLVGVCQWLESFVLEWLGNVILSDDSLHEQYKARLEFHVFETLCEVRMTELFDMITEFPDSTNAILDLKESLERTHQYRDLVQCLRSAFSSRLLHPGANTSQILDVYIATIKSLRLLDPSGVLLEAISEPVKAYLRNREDTIRCIVTSLTDDSNSELFEGVGTENVSSLDIASDDECENTGESWIPDPIEADPSKTSKSRKSNDILSMLVHIYGSKELFVNEYRLMLADKLLSNVNEIDVDREVRNLELLKLRFGENSMTNCEIMIKDIEDSRRINANIKPTIASKLKDQDTDFSSAQLHSMEVTIVSKQFWPTLHGQDIELHPLIQNRMKVIAHEYSVLKNPRQLVWKTNLGMVHLELEFNGGQTKEFTVAPIFANIIMHLADRDSWSASELADTTKLDMTTLSKRVAYWINQGVVKTKKSNTGALHYLVVESLSADQQSQLTLDEDASESAVSGDAQLAEEMQVYESFVRGMLNNYESLPLDRIHNMLKMFVSSGEHKYDKTVQQLESFLGQLVVAEILVFTAGSYFLKK